MTLQFKAYDPAQKTEIEALIDSDDFVRADMLKCLADFPQLGLLAYEEECLVGAAVFTGERAMTSFTLFIKPEARRQGYGRALHAALTEKMKGAGVKEVVCDFLNKDPEANFINKMGYLYWFQSNHMTYKGGLFPEPQCQIVPYQDDYYTRCQEIQSDSFHRMRLAVGMPSEKAQPSEADRKNYLEEAESIYVLLNQGQIAGILRLEGGEIDSLAVAYTLQGKGFGKALTQYGVNRILEAGYDRVTLWAVEGNPAKMMYEKLGFNQPRLHTFVKKKISD